MDLEIMKSLKYQGTHHQAFWISIWNARKSDNSHLQNKRHGWQGGSVSRG